MFSSIILFQDSNSFNAITTWSSIHEVGSTKSTNKAGCSPLLRILPISTARIFRSGISICLFGKSKLNHSTSDDKTKAPFPWIWNFPALLWYRRFAQKTFAIIWPCAKFSLTRSSSVPHQPPECPIKYKNTDEQPISLCYIHKRTNVACVHPPPPLKYSGRRMQLYLVWTLEDWCSNTLIWLNVESKSLQHIEPTSPRTYTVCFLFRFGYNREAFKWSMSTINNNYSIDLNFPNPRFYRRRPSARNREGTCRQETWIGSNIYFRSPFAAQKTSGA